MSKYIEIMDSDYNKIMHVSNIHKISIMDVIHNIVSNNDLIFISKPHTLIETIADNTIKKNIITWINNIRNNLPEILQCKDVSDMKINNKVLCIADGPSFHYELENGLRDKLYNFNGTIMCCEKNLMDLLRSDIVPDYFCSVDGDDIMATFIDDPLLDEHIDDMAGVFSVMCSNKLVNRWKGDKYFFTALIDNPTKHRDSCTLVMQHLTKTTVIYTGGNCGSLMLFLSMYKKAEKVGMLGIDFAYKTDIDLSDTGIWDAIYSETSTEEEILANYYRKTNKFGNDIIIDTSFDCFLKSMMSWIYPNNKLCDFFQCGIYSALDEHPIKCITVDDFLVL